ncbi:hypothetical protein PGO_103070 [Plasmodium gonderi]|uniref:Uncharacterized protein n=1 Tax=Plasmodium gonderi TaxID=77519 RepID=A0A1Y1JIS7_PLAGO|nr:hypothetical protein PGO_103070 [Plasmodium gonderi]GAW81548.1 hypothetical protein PGO_103070 [Plasmodium gonderi]
MNEEEDFSCYFNFLVCGLHLSKKYNLKFQRRLYEDLLDMHYYKGRVKNFVFPEESYLKYDNLKGLYNYTKGKCQDGNYENMVKYGYIYSCYKLKKEKRKNILLMLIDEEFIKYRCNNNIHEKYEKKDIHIYKKSFYDIKKLPGYSAGYYIMGKLYEKEAKSEWINNERKKKLIDTAFCCYYLCYKSCPFLVCALKKLLKLHGNFYSNVMYVEEVEKFSKLYNFGIPLYQLKTYGSFKRGNSERKMEEEEDEVGKWDEKEMKGREEREKNEEEWEEDGDTQYCEENEDGYCDEVVDRCREELVQVHIEGTHDVQYDEKRILNIERTFDIGDIIFELLEFRKEENSIVVQDADFILRLVEEEEMRKFFAEWENLFERDIYAMIGDKECDFISEKGILNLSTVGKFYHYFYINEFRKCLELIDKWEDKPIFSLCTLYLKGLCNFLLRNYEKAIFFFERIHDIEFFYTKHLPFLSTCYWHEKEIDKIEHILLSYEKKEINEDFLCLIGNYFSLKNNKKLSADFFRKAIKLNKFYEYAYILYSCEMKYLGKIRKAALALSKCLQINACNFKAHLLLSTILFEERNYELANVHLSLCLKLNNSDALVCIYCASIYNHQQKYETALLCLEHAQKNDYEGVDLYIMQGVIFLKMKRNQDALNSFLKAQKINPLCSYIKMLIAFTLVLEKNFDKSKRMIKELILQNSNNINRNFLKDMYKCCNLKTVPNECILNKIELFLREGSFLEYLNIVDNSCQL